MTIARVNSASITNTTSGTTSATATIPAGTGILAGDLIIVCAGSQTGHTANGISVQDAVNTTNYTTILETQLGGASSRWMQTFAFITPVNIADGTVITCTGYATATNTEFSVDVFRGATATISRAAVGSSNASSTTSVAPALGSAPPAGDLPLTFCMAGSGTLTPASPFTKGSSGTTGAATAVGYVLSADGSSTYGSTWTLGTANTSAAQTVAFAAAVVASGPRAAMQVSPPFAWPLVIPPFIGASQPLGNPAVGTGSALVVSRPRLPRRPLRAILTASFPLGNPAVPTPSPLVVSSPWSAKVPGALLFGPGAPAVVVSTVGTPSPSVVSPPFAWPYIPAVSVTASQPLGNPAVGTPEPLVIGPPFVPAPIPGVRLFAAPTTIGAPAPIVSVPAFTLAPVPGAKVFAAPQAPVVVSTAATPGPLVVGPPWQPVAIPRTYLTWSQPLGRPAVGSPGPLLVGPTFRWPAWTPSLLSSAFAPVAVCFTPRPFAGTTPRPDAGDTAYALATTARSSAGITVRADTGETQNPC